MIKSKKTTNPSASLHYGKITIDNEFGRCWTTKFFGQGHLCKITVKKERKREKGNIPLLFFILIRAKILWWLIYSILYKSMNTFRMYINSNIICNVNSNTARPRQITRASKRDRERRGDEGAAGAAYAHREKSV